MDHADEHRETCVRVTVRMESQSTQGQSQTSKASRRRDVGHYLCWY